jgi:hypothetical protein
MHKRQRLGAYHQSKGRNGDRNHLYIDLYGTHELTKFKKNLKNYAYLFHPIPIVYKI